MEEHIKLDENRDPVKAFDSIVLVEESLIKIEDLIYECTVLLAQAKCFDFMREIDKKEGRVLEVLMTDSKR